MYPNQPNQQPYNSYASPQQVGAKESFIGINLLSKIGVIFIIIGVIAFSAVSEDFLAPGIRTAIIFALGLAMTALGEVFYRTSSVIFARALTIGGIGELAVSVLIGFFGYQSLGEIASLFIAVIIAAGSLLLSLRYNSQTIVTVATVCGFLPCFATFSSEAGVLCSLPYLLLLQTAIVIICGKKNWYIAPYFMEFSNFVIGIKLFAAMCELYDDAIAALISTAYIVLSTIVPITAAIIRAFKNNGNLSIYDTVSFIASASVQLLLSLIFLSINDTILGFGLLALFLGLAYFAIAAVANTTFERCTLMTALFNSAIISISLAIPCICPENAMYIVFHVYAVGLFIFGHLSHNRLIKIWGIITCSVAEYAFATLCTFNIGENIFILQFGTNALLWLIILVMLVLTERKLNSGMKAYSIVTIINTVLLCLYLIIRLLNILEDNGTLDTTGECLACFMLFAAIVWMAAAFITGKLKFLDKAAPVTSIIFYLIGLCGIGITNLASCISSPAENIICLIASIAVNAISVAAVLDITIAANSLTPKFAKATGLVVSMFALFSLTFTLAANDIVAFTNCIISIIYLAVAILWIVWGFARRNALMRRFGLALTLLASAKLFLLDFTEIGAVGKTLMFILFGIVLLTVSFIYAVFEKKLKKQMLDEALYQQQLQYYNYYNSIANNTNNQQK